MENIPYFHLFSPSLPFLFSVYSVFTIYDVDFGKQLLKGRFFENKLFEHSEKLQGKWSLKSQKKKSLEASDETKILLSVQSS